MSRRRVANVAPPRVEQRHNLYLQLCADGYRVLDDLSPTRALHLISGVQQRTAYDRPRRTR